MNITTVQTGIKVCTMHATVKLLYAIKVKRKFGIWNAARDLHIHHKDKLDVKLKAKKRELEFNSETGVFFTFSSCRFKAKLLKTTKTIPL